MDVPDELRGRWNHNAHYYPLALDGARGRALDVGCGDGMLLRLLAPRCDEVVGLDACADMVATARAECEGLPNVSVRHGELLRSDFPDASFDLVASFAAVHHMPFVPALRRMADLVRPGGRLVVVGLARNVTPRDWLLGVPGLVAHRVLSRRYGFRHHPAPIVDPTAGWGDVRRATQATLPAARWRRRVLWRYSIVWQRPD